MKHKLEMLKELKKQMSERSVHKLKLRKKPLVSIHVEKPDDEEIPETPELEAVEEKDEDGVKSLKNRFQR